MKLKFEHGHWGGSKSTDWWEDLVQSIPPDDSYFNVCDFRAWMYRWVFNGN